MASLDEVDNIARLYIQALENGSKNVITPIERFGLYTKFGRLTSRSQYCPDNQDFIRWNYSNIVKNRFLDITIGDKTLGWLAVLTAKKVLFVWDRVKEQVEADPKLLTTPHELIETGEKLLSNSMNINDALELYGDYNTGLGIQNIVTFDVANSFTAAYRALELIIFGSEIVNSSFKSNNGRVYESRADFVERAIDAFVSIDPNPPGEFWDAGISSISFDKLKQLEFWKWWLTEAIPQAWELAHQSINQ